MWVRKRAEESDETATALQEVCCARCSPAGLSHRNGVLRLRGQSELPVPVRSPAAPSAAELPRRGFLCFPLFLPTRPSPLGNGLVGGRRRPQSGWRHPVVTKSKNNRALGHSKRLSERSEHACGVAATGGRNENESNTRRCESGMRVRNDRKTERWVSADRPAGPVTFDIKFDALLRRAAVTAAGRCGSDG